MALNSMLKCLKNYDIVEVMSGDNENYYDLEIDVKEGLRKMTKLRKQQAIKLLLQFQDVILDQQVEALHNHDGELFNKLCKSFDLLEDIRSLIYEAPEDD